MSYVTRCPNCRTAFKVTETQLAAHGGKVRCGKCAFIFNARDSLELQASTEKPAPVVERAAPQVVPTPVAAAPAPVSISAQPAAKEYIPVFAPAPAPIETPAPSPVPAPLLAPAPLPTPTPAAVAHTPQAAIAPDLAKTITAAPQESVQDWLENSYVQAIAAVAAEAEATDYDDYVAPPVATPTPAIEPVVSTATAPAAEPVAPPVAAEPAHVATEEEPIFTVPLETWSAQASERGEGYFPIRTAEDDALLALPPARPKWHYAALPVAVLLILLLVFQAGIRYRNELSVNFPWLRPPLTSVCQLFGCDLPLPRNASLLRSDYSELIFVPDHPELIQLSASLRNLAAYDQALPSLELTLTNAQEEVVAKKVFTAKDYLVANEKKRSALATNDELHVFLQLNAAGLNASGYSLYWFYP